MLLSSWNFIFFSLQNKKKLLSNSEIPEWVLCFLTTFNLFFSTHFKQTKKPPTHSGSHFSNETAALSIGNQAPSYESLLNL